MTEVAVKLEDKTDVDGDFYDPSAQNLLAEEAYLEWARINLPESLYELERDHLRFVWDYENIF